MSAVLDQLLPAQSAGGGDAFTVLGIIPSVGGTNNAAKFCRVAAPSGYTTVTGAATNNATISFGYRRNGGTRVVIATQDLVVGKTITAGNTLTIPVTLSPATSLAPGDVVDVLLHQNGTGLAIGAGLCASIDVD